MFFWYTQNQIYGKMNIGDSMANLYDVKSSLHNNSNLDAEVRDNIFELVMIFNNKFPEVSLDRFNEHAKTLKIKKTNKFLNSDISMYDYRHNILYFNKSRMTDEYDFRHILMYELLNIASSTDTKRGFIQDGRFEALNVGFTEIMANYLVGNEGNKALFQQQAIETNLISIIIGSEVLKKAYFTNDTELLIKGFEDAGVDV